MKVQRAISLRKQPNAGSCLAVAIASFQIILSSYSAFPLGRISTENLNIHHTIGGAPSDQPKHATQGWHQQGAIDFPLFSSKKDSFTTHQENGRPESNLNIKSSLSFKAEENLPVIVRNGFIFPAQLSQPPPARL